MTPKYNAFQTRIDLFKLTRQFKLRAFFGTNSCMPDKKVFKPKSQFTPCLQNDDISVFERLVMRDVRVVEGKSHHYNHNLSMREREALDSLSSDDSIIIRIREG